MSTTVKAETTTHPTEDTSQTTTNSTTSLKQRKFNFEHVTTNYIQEQTDFNDNKHQKKGVIADANADQAHDDKSASFGTTEEGEKFVIPSTHNTLDTFHPLNFSIISFACVCCIAINLGSILFVSTSNWPHIAYFFFWRCCYDIGLGFILRNQSKSRWFSEKYKNIMTMCSKDKSSIQFKFMTHLAKSQLKNQSLDLYCLPSDFRAWLVYKNFVNFILVNDACNYLLLALKLYNMPESFLSPIVIGQYSLGFVFCLFNYWAKIDAHRCIGEYAWYWGDFFYQKHGTLKFNGIFELFPHPMYTVGYSLYYGYSMITRSYTLLYISLCAHIMQLCFLVLIEEPHIQKLYGKPSDPSSKTQTFANQQVRSSPIYFWNMKLPFSVSDSLLVVVCCYVVMTTLLSSHGSVFLLVHVVLWRCFHWFGIGFILWNQSQREWWTRKFVNRFGQSIFDSFLAWKQLYNSSLTINWLVFVACCVKFHSYTCLYDVLNPGSITCIVVGCICIGICSWSCLATYQAIGDFGWFYGDFFLYPEDKSYLIKNIKSPSNQPTESNPNNRELTYSSIFRYLNNPDCVTGYAGQYGAALICQSYSIFALALFSHLLNIIFINIVEVPHMNKLYTREKIRTQAPLDRALNRVTNKILPKNLQREVLEDVVKKQVKEIKMKALMEVYDLYKKMRNEQNLFDQQYNQNGTSSNNSTPRNNPTPLTVGADSPSHITTPPLELTRRRSLEIPQYADFSLFAPSPTNLQSQHFNKGIKLLAHSQNSSTDDVRVCNISQALIVEYEIDPNLYKYNDTDWIGVYPVEIPSMPGSSQGKWKYIKDPTTNNNCYTDLNSNNQTNSQSILGKGQVTFPAFMLPKHSGVYEVRYHIANRYKTLASQVILLKTDLPSPMPQK